MDRPTSGPDAAPPAPLLSFEDVHVAPSASRVRLRGVRFTLDAGEILGVLGPARSSKSLLLRVAAGIVAPASGRVRALGAEPAWDTGGVRGEIGLAGSHDRSFNPRLTARENLEFFARLHGFPNRASADEAIERSLHAMDLLGVLTGPVSRFPTGLLLRLSIARALLGSPRLLLLDEPTAGLEHGRRDRFYSLLSELVRGRRMGVLWATRDLTEAQYLCTRVLLLDEGRLVGDGSWQSVEPMAERLFLRESAELAP